MATTRLTGLASRRALVVLALVPFLLAAAALKPAERESLPYVQWVGHDSKSPAGFQLIRDDAAWKTLWSTHTGAAASHTPPTRHAVPKVDFTQCMVIAYFRGPSTNRDGEELTSVSIDKDLSRCRFIGSTFQTSGGLEGGGGAVSTQPYGIWVLPRASTPIVIEEGRRGLKSDPIQWKEVHRFAAREW